MKLECSVYLGFNEVAALEDYLLICFWASQTTDSFVSHINLPGNRCHCIVL
jgi:hypothetical protein